MEEFNNNINNSEGAENKVYNENSAGNFQNTPSQNFENGFYNRQKTDIIQDNVPQHTATSHTGYNQGYTSQKSPFNYSNNNYPPIKKQKRGHGALVVALSCILAAIIGAASGAGVVWMTQNNKETEKVTPQASKNNYNISIEETAESVVEAVAVKVTPSVVGIRTTTSVISFFGGTSQASGNGSGVVYSEDGYIVTNYHVIANAISTQASSSKKIEVFLDSASSKAYEATVVGYNISADLAVIKIDEKGLVPIDIAKSDDLKVGQYAITIGAPGGLEFMDSVTFGVISGLDRVVSADTGIELIQTDAAINPGNSGGALVNTKGELIGINSSKIVAEEFEGMGFAIPSNTVVEICENIISKENSPEPYVGISISERYTSQVLQYYGYPTGAVVLSVAENSPAQEAGIERGDIITEFNKTKITEYTMLDDAIRNSSPGDTVAVKIYRDGRYYSTTIKIAANSSIQ